MNIDGFGHRFEPAIDFEAEDADARVPAHTVRLMPIDTGPVEVEDRVQVSPVAFETMPARRRMRRFVQVQGVDRVYFKAFGDPRSISKRTAKVFATPEALRRADPEDAPATEILHFAIHSTRSPYGVPRWVGALLCVLGSRQMEEVNYLYFENKSVPPLAVLISGGRLSESSVPRIERFIDENLKGNNNFHKILILEAEGGQGDSRAKIELRPLTDAQQQDALFQVYDERNIDKVGGSFRLPRLLRGESKDFNRATAESALRFAEDQVFKPERDLVATVPLFINYRLSSVPEHLPWEDVRRLITSVDTTVAPGKRDRAILLLIASLGLRPGAVRALTLEQIFWREAEGIGQAALHFRRDAGGERGRWVAGRQEGSRQRRCAGYWGVVTHMC